jgi:hypothetical protein
MTLTELKYIVAVAREQADLPGADHRLHAVAERRRPVSQLADPLCVAPSGAADVDRSSETKDVAALQRPRRLDSFKGSVTRQLRFDGRPFRPPRLDSRYTTMAGGLTAQVSEGCDPIKVRVPAATP